MSKQRVVTEEDVAYGKHSATHKYGVKELTSDWQYFKQSSQRTPPRDFMGINKLAIQQKNDSSFRRKLQDLPVPQKKGQPQEKTKLAKLPPSSFIYGRNSDVQNDFKELVGGMYGLVYEFEQDQRVRNNNSVAQLNNRHALKVQQQNQCVSPRLNPPFEAIPDKKQFKLSRFQNVAPKTNCRRESQQSLKTLPF